ncbi:hypothetical protein [Kribbella shirazensis]|uniref:Uncharacterized protein n=1 Tax=Kribbella shirazensis TaxID=1105143 RepID=A0A7X5V4A8_9ACTN|nr:hypothetical protein [Kribbella shirazensis]NIK54312.1 hypothetical protein [Kribbella shirazensis]
MTSELEYAQAILDGQQAVTPRWIRIAAFLTRQALEAEIEAYCELLIAPMPFPVRMRSRLAVLHALDQTGFNRMAEYSWNALSRACHHHAYELSPTISELRHLHSKVVDLAAMRAAAAGAPK